MAVFGAWGKTRQASLEMVRELRRKGLYKYHKRAIVVRISSFRILCVRLDVHVPSLLLAKLYPAVAAATTLPPTTAHGSIAVVTTRSPSEFLASTTATQASAVTTGKSDGTFHVRGSAFEC